MRRRLLEGAIIFVAVGVLAGCQKAEEPVAQQPPPSKMPPGQQFGYPSPGTNAKK